MSVRPGVHEPLDGSAFSPVQVLILSLFLQLLVFFILMNSVSVFSQARDRLREMQDSLTKGAVPSSTDMSVFPTIGRLNGPGTAENDDDKIARFAHQIPGLANISPRRAGVMEMTMGASALNQLLGLTSINHKADPRLAEMIRFVSAHKQDGYVVTLLQNIRPELYHAGAVDMAVVQYTIPLWMNALQKMGLPASMLRIGVGPGEAGSITIRIDRENSDMDTPAASSQSAEVSP